MNGLHIEGFLVSGVMLGFLLQPDENSTTLMLTFFVIGLKITWW